MITDENKKWLAQKVDDAINAKGLLELVDGMLARVAINLVDDFATKKLKPSDEIVLEINKLIEAAKNENIEEAEEIASYIINSLVDVPGIDEDGETILFEAGVKLIVGAIKIALKK